MRQAVIFDLDGTLTVPVLDFDTIRAEIGLPPGPILEALEHMKPPERARAQAILDAHERGAAEQSALQDGAVETVAELGTRGFAVGIVTRNSRRWTEYVLSRHRLTVDGLHTRDDGAIKPDPQGVLDLCRRFKADPDSSWMVGDYLFDIQAGTRAGLTTVLMISDRPKPAFADQADHVIRALPELIDIVSSTSQV